MRLLTAVLSQGLQQLGYTVNDAPVFDTITVSGGSHSQAQIKQAALNAEVNLRYFENGDIGISLDEITLAVDLEKLFIIFGAEPGEIGREMPGVVRALICPQHSR